MVVRSLSLWRLCYVYIVSHDPQTVGVTTLWFGPLTGYKFCVLPFCLARNPPVFTGVVNAVVRQVHLSGIWMRPCLDNWLIPSSSLQPVTLMFSWLWTNPPIGVHSQLVPVQIFTNLGILRFTTSVWIFYGSRIQPYRNYETATLRHSSAPHSLVCSFYPEVSVGHSDSEMKKTLPIHGLLFLISSKDFFYLHNCHGE